MLRALTLKNFAVVESASLALEDGFTAITGETGAGKSILVDAVGLLVGDRAETSWVRKDAERAELTAEFDLTALPQLESWLQEQALDTGGECLLRRVINSNGRSRAFINGTPVTVTQLSELGSQLVEIHGQHSFQALTTPSRQRQLLDASGVDSAYLEAVANAFSTWKIASRALKSFNEALEGSDTDLDYLRFQLRELQSTALDEEAYAALERQHRLASHAGDLLSALNSALALISDDDDRNAISLVSRALVQIKAVAELDDEISGVQQMLEDARINLQEASHTVSARADAVELDPDVLNALDDQMSAIHQLARKHRVDAGELDALRQRQTERLQQLENADEERSRLESALEKAGEDYRVAALKLCKARQQQAGILGKRTETELEDLGMAGATVAIQVSHDPEAKPTVLGTDRVEIMAALNAGHPQQAIRKVASGGELSRLSLALKVASRAAGGAPTLIFDEVDAGIGGQTAHEVGRSLSRLSESAQTLCVTHLAQVAARANQQFSVRKISGDQLTAVTTNAVKGDARVQEIARMLGGESSDQGLAHAAAMLAAQS